jgi:hypothetical protein
MTTMLAAMHVLSQSLTKVSDVVQFVFCLRIEKPFQLNVARKSRDRKSA